MKQPSTGIMPALERLFSDPLPEGLYLDTDIFIASMLEPEPHHERCRAFLMRIAEEGVATLYTSSLTWLEFTNVVIRAQFRARLPDEWHRRFRLARWQDASVRQAYLAFLLGTFEGVLDQLSLYEIWLTPAIRQTALEYVSTYNLRPYDAVHLSSASYVGVSNVASLDEAFRPVDGLVLWNDQVHVRRPA